MIGYKKCIYFSINGSGKGFCKEALVTLKIPDDAKIIVPSNINIFLSGSPKFRCNKAVVLDIEDVKSGEKIDAAYSMFNMIEVFGSLSICSSDKAITIYEIGKTIYPDDLDENPQCGCAKGIHFFTSKESALEYRF